MTYFRPHFMMPALGENPRTHDPPMTNGGLNSYDQALDLGQSQQNSLQKQQAAQAAAAAAQHKAQHTTIKHEQVDHSRYGFDQVNYSGSQPSTEKKKDDQKYACDQCSYVATQKSSLSRHKQ